MSALFVTSSNDFLIGERKSTIFRKMLYFADETFGHHPS